MAMTNDLTVSNTQMRVGKLAMQSILTVEGMFSLLAGIHSQDNLSLYSGHGGCVMHDSLFYLAMLYSSTEYVRLEWRYRNVRH